MTIILGLGNEEQVIQFSDRRLSWAGGVKEEESNKAGVLVCETGRFAFGFTGLAAAGAFKTMDWLLDTLLECGPPEYTMVNIIGKLKARLEARFAQPDLRRFDRRVSILFSGFAYGSGRPEPASVILSNFESLATNTVYPAAQDQFLLSVGNADFSRPDPILLEYVGNHSAITESDLERFAEMLTVRKPTHALTDVAAAYLRELADRPKSVGAIGKQLSSIRIDADLNKPVETLYHSAVNKMVAHMPAMVYLLPGNRVIMKGGIIEAVSPGASPISGPRVSKNSRCPCIDPAANNLNFSDPP